MSNRKDLERRFEQLADGTDEDAPGPKWADLPEPTPEEKERLDKRFDVVPATAVDPETWGGNDGE